MTADVHALAGAYALDALPSDERAFFERHLAACDACRAEVAELTETAARLGTATAQAPPPGLRERVLAAADITRQLPPEPDPTPADVAEARRPWSQRWLLPVAACLAIVAVVAGGLAVNLNNQLRVARQLAAADSDVVAVLSAPDLRTVELDMGTPNPGRFLYSAAEDQGVLVATGMPDVGADETYELWLIHDGTPVNAGLFRPGEGGTAVAAVDGSSVRGAELVAVTVEPAGGSRRPTGRVLASAEL